MWSGIFSIISSIGPGLLNWVRDFFREREVSERAVLKDREKRRQKEEELAQKLIKTSRNKKRLDNDPNKRD